MPAKRKTTTSSEVKNRWNADHYRVFRAQLRKADDAELIKWIETHREQYSVADILRAGLEALMGKEN